MSSKVNKRTNFYKRKPVCNGFYIISELEDVLKSGYYESPLGCENFYCFFDEVLKLEKKMNFFFKKTEKDIIMTEKMKKKLQIIIVVDFVRKKFYLIKLEIIVI